MSKMYKLVFANQSVEQGTSYSLVRETKMYYFLRDKDSPHIFRIHKTTLNTKGIHVQDNYRFDVPRPKMIIEL